MRGFKVSLSIVTPAFCLFIRVSAAAGQVAIEEAGAHRNATPAWTQETSWELSREATLQIGVDTGPPEYQLYRVANVIALPNGEIVIANSGTGELRFYDPEGRFRRSFGSRGRGPEEFESLSWVALVARIPC